MSTGNYYLRCFNCNREFTYTSDAKKYCPGHIDGSDTCVICGRDIPEGSQVCVICGREIPKKQRQIDRIRNMSVDKLAEFMQATIEDCEKYCAFTKNGKCNSFGIEDKCAVGIKQWLESEVDTE